MKKFVSILVVMILALSLIGCAKPSEAAPTETSKEETVETQTYGDIRPEVKQAIDDYEAFFNEYCDFIAKYTNASEEEQLSMMGECATILAKYAEMSESFQNLNERDDLTTDELVYYMEVVGRLSAKAVKTQALLDGKEN